jgi:hypothetical protein
MNDREVAPTVPKAAPGSQEDRDLYALYDELDHLEELLEDMSELGVVSAEEAERRIAELNDRIDARESAEPR